MRLTLSVEYHVHSKVTVGSVNLTRTDVGWGCRLDFNLRELYKGKGKGKEKIFKLKLYEGHFGER